MTAVAEAPVRTAPTADLQTCCSAPHSAGMRVLTHQPTSLEGVPATGTVVCVDEVDEVAYEFDCPSAAQAWLAGAALEPVVVRKADEDERVEALACVELGTW